MKFTWQMWNQALGPEYCDYIVAQSLKHPATGGMIGKVVESAKAAPEVRVSTLRWLAVDGEDRDIAEQLMWFCKRSNLAAFGLDIDMLFEIQFTEYRGAEGGKYDWHQDVQWDNDAPYDRKLSIIVQLSNPDEYTGGEFEFFGLDSPGADFRNRGSVLVFPSFLHHRVLPVTSGVRHSLVSWVVGPKFR